MLEVQLRWDLFGLLRNRNGFSESSVVQRGSEFEALLQLIDRLPVCKDVWLDQFIHRKIKDHGSITVHGLSSVLADPFSLHSLFLPLSLP